MDFSLNARPTEADPLGSTLPCTPNGFHDHRTETSNSGAKGVPMRSL